MNTEKNIIINKFNIETLPTIKELNLFQSAFKNILTIAFKNDGLYFYNFNTNYHVKLSNQCFTQDTLVSLSIIAMTKIIELLTILNNQDWQIELFNNDVDVKAFRITSEKFTANVFHAGSKEALYPNFESINKIKPLHSFNAEQLKQLKSIYQASNIRYQTLANSFNFTENSVFTVGDLIISLPFNTPKELINKSIHYDRVMFLINNKNCNQIDIKIKDDEILFNDWQMIDSNIDSVDLNKYNEITNNDNQYFKILEIPKTKKSLLPFYNMIKSIKDTTIDILIKDNKLTIQKRTIDGFFTYTTDIESNIKECSVTTNKSCLLGLFKKQNIKAFLYNSKSKIFLHATIENVEYHALCKEYDHKQEIRIKTQESINIMKTCIDTMYKKHINDSLKNQLSHIKTEGQPYLNYLTGFTVAEFVPSREMIVFKNRDKFNIYDSFTKMTLLDSKEQAESFACECSSLTGEIKYIIIELKNNAIIYHYEYKTKTALNKDYELAQMLQNILNSYSNRMYSLNIEKNLVMFLSKKSNAVNRSYGTYSKNLLLDISTDIEAYKQAIESIRAYPYKHKDIIDIDNMIYKYSKTEYKLYCKDNTEQKTPPKETTMSTKLQTQKEALLHIYQEFKQPLESMQELINTVSQYDYESRIDFLETDLEKTVFKGLKKEVYKLLVNFTEVNYLESLYQVIEPITQIESIVEQSNNIIIASVPPIVEEVAEIVIEDITSDIQAEEVAEIVIVAEEVEQALKDVPITDLEPITQAEAVEQETNPSEAGCTYQELSNSTQNEPRFIIKLFTDRQKSKVLSPEVFKIDTIEGDFIISKGYKYSIYNIGKVRISKKGKGSASINLTLDHKPTMDELKDLSDQFISKITTK